MKRMALVSALALTLALPALVSAGEHSRAKNNDTPWIHIEVMEDGGRDATVKVNLPLSLASLALDMIEDDANLVHGSWAFDHGEITVSDLRKMWRELRDAGDAEFVTVEEDDETVKIYRNGDTVHLDVDSDDGDRHVTVEIPVALVDALLGGKGDRLDIEAALAELQNLERGDIVRVRDGGDRVHIWID